MYKLLYNLFRRPAGLYRRMGVCRLRYWCVNIYILFFLIFRYHVKACAPQGVEVTCHPDRMELKFPATAVGGYQEQVVQKKTSS